MTQTISCPRCGAEVAPGSRFCAHCGAALARSGTLELRPERPSLETREQLAKRPIVFRRTMHAVRRRPFGLEPATALGGASAFALVIAVVLLAAGVWIAAIIELGLAIGLVALFVSAIRDEPDSSAARLARKIRTRAGALATLVAVHVRAWTRAAVALVRIKQRRHRLQRRLRTQLRPLGEAVHRGDVQRTEELKAQAHELEQAVKQADIEASSVVEEARERIGQERATAQPTQELSAARRSE